MPAVIAAEYHCSERTIYNICKNEKTEKTIFANCKNAEMQKANRIQENLNSREYELNTNTSLNQGNVSNKKRAELNRRTTDSGVKMGGQAATPSPKMIGQSVRPFG